jgi:predicted restriction endonuclease
MLKRQLKLTDEDKAWAKAVKDRDGWQCVICGSMVRLNAHHLIVRENHETKLDIRNGLSLCPKHHFFCRQISAHNNPIGLFFWLEKNRPETLQYLREEMAKLVRS